MSEKEKDKKKKGVVEDFQVEELVIRGVGRPKGQGNIINKNIKARMTEFLENHFEQFTLDFNALPSQQRAEAYVVLYKHAVPKAVKEEDNTSTSEVKEFVESTLF